MNYVYNKSSSILWMGSTYCWHVHVGILHFPTFINESFSSVDVCASTI